MMDKSYDLPTSPQGQPQLLPSQIKNNQRFRSIADRIYTPFIGNILMLIIGQTGALLLCHLVHF